jgi:hypothetical protein
MLNLSDRSTHSTSYLRRSGVLLLALIFTACTWFSPAVQAQAAGAQRAIEKLEGCKAEERKSGCVRILKVESRPSGKQAIKAQVRGRRIIWYEYDLGSGKVRRTN